jgi:hypothetical protein
MLRHEAQTLGFLDSVLPLADNGSQQQMQMVALTRRNFGQLRDFIK